MSDDIYSFAHEALERIDRQAKRVYVRRKLYCGGCGRLIVPGRVCDHILNPDLALGEPPRVHGSGSLPLPEKADEGSPIANPSITDLYNHTVTPGHVPGRYRSHGAIHTGSIR